MQQQFLHSRFRLYAVVLAACVVGICWWMAYVQSGWQQILIVLISLVVTLIVPLGICHELTVAQNSLTATAEITEYQRGGGRYPSGVHIEYRFVASVQNTAGNRSGTCAALNEVEE